MTPLRSYFLWVAAILLAGLAFMAWLPPVPRTIGLYTLVWVSVSLGMLYLSRNAFNDGKPLDIESRIPEPSQGDGHSVSYMTSRPPKKKHPQFILAMEAAFFDSCYHFAKDLNLVAMEDFLSWPETASALVLKERGTLEPDGNYRQLLPYMIVRQLGSDGVTRYLAYQRGSGVGEGRLVGKVSIGFGGHVDASSVVWNRDDSVNLRDTIVSSAAREMHEELRIVGQPDFKLGSAPDLCPKFANQFITHQEGVQRMHLGIVMILDVPHDLELECAEDELTTLGFMTANQLLGQALDGYFELEVWSQLLLEEAASRTAHEEEGMVAV